MELRPIFFALLRHKTMFALLVAVIALSCAVVSNSSFLLALRLERLHMPSGIAEDRLVEVSLDSDPHDDPATAKARTEEALAALRRLPHVEAVSMSNLAPLDDYDRWGGAIALTPEDAAAMRGPVAAIYAGDHFAETLDVQLIEGHLLDPGAFTDFTGLIEQTQVPGHVDALVTQALAQRLWPGQHALGKVFYLRGDRTLATVVGVLAHLPRSWIGDDGGADYSVVLPMYTVADRSGYYYLLRADEPANRDRVLRAALDTLHALNPHCVAMIKRPLAEARAAQLGRDQSMAWILMALCTVLLAVTGAGIVGLASYWVRRRRRQIGVRRALGATRGAILRYFMIENFVLTTLGVALGMGLAYGLSRLLMAYYELPRLPLWYFPVGAVALWLTGQLAVLVPAWRASRISPAVAAAS